MADLSPKPLQPLQEKQDTGGTGANQASQDKNKIARRLGTSVSRNDSCRAEVL